MTPNLFSVEQLVRIRPCMAGADFLPPSPDTKHGDLTSAKSVIDLVSGMQAVRKTPDEIIERVGNADKDEDKAAEV
jgi:hypothetical protein